MSNYFWRSKLIPEEYRKWLDKQFVKVLNTKPDMGNGANPQAAIEELLEDFKKNHQPKEKEEE